MKFIAAMLLLVSAGSAAVARPHVLDREVTRRMSPHWDRCIDEPGGIWDLIDCNSREMDLQDGRLKRTYRNVMSRLSRVRREQLRTSERAWVRKRDAACDAYAQIRESPLTTQYALDFSSCMLRATIVRTILIERYAAGKTSLADLGRDYSR